MTPRELIDFMAKAEKLKANLRHSWLSDGRQESVAEHSWRLSLMVLLTKEWFPAADMERVLKMAVLHDLGEAVTGDIPAFHKTERDREEERQALRRLLKTLPDSLNHELTALFDEMEALETEESKICHALDKLECLMQHNEADLSSWLPLERELNLTYAKEAVSFSPCLQMLDEEICRDSLRKMAQDQK